MLEELSVRNYALIESLSISFNGGLTVLSGETGAGKSIIVGSLGFLLGAKADAQMIRLGAEEAQVSAVISIKETNTDALEWLKKHNIETEDGRIIVRRNIKTNGRTAIYIQNEPLNRSELADFMAFLFDIHGQHAHESLLRKETHRRYLDRFAGLEAEADEFNKIFLELAEKRKTLENSAANERDRGEKIEYLSFAVGEIEQAALKIGENKELESESKRLASYEKLAAHIEAASTALYEEDSVLSLARKAKAALDAASAIDSSLSAICQRVSSLFYEAEDLSSELREYCSLLSFDPQRLEAVEERLALLYKLKKKYASKNHSGETENMATEEAILSYKANAEAEIEALKSSEQDKDALKNQIAQLERDIALKASALSAKRREAAGRLSSRISEILTELGMPNAAFSVSLEAKNAQNENPGTMLLGPWGADNVEFLIQANTGESAKELARIASGGELSRVMLAIKTALINEDQNETLIFDEIDTGIGGEVALSVGDYLYKIGAIKQIFCITHLANIAALADNHLKVEKSSDGMRTTTQLVNLKGENRLKEIARLLSGGVGQTALAHAAELLEKYGGRNNEQN